jgi:hypothetical protein
MFLKRRLPEEPRGYFVKTSPVTDAVLRSHFLGELTAGFYALAPDNSVRWICLDADSADGLERLRDAWKALEAQKISAYLEKSRRGGHLWIFFEDVSAQPARRLILGSVPRLEGVEVFPKQDRLDQDTQYGSLVRGPLGIHKLTGQRYPFLDPISLNPVSRSVVGTIEYLSFAQKVPLTQVAEAKILLPPETAEPSTTLRRSSAYSPLQRLKQELGDPYEFISRFVELDERGRGHCPFHPPDRHPSFAVDRQRGFWVDFHEVNPKTGRYVGGDAIEFYKRLTGLSYKQILDELGRR